MYLNLDSDVSVALGQSTLEHTRSSSLENQSKLKPA